MHPRRRPHDEAVIHHDGGSEPVDGATLQPACVKACPADALLYGTREEMLKVAHQRIAARPDKYVNHVYGEKELGGTQLMMLSGVSFDKLGYPTLPERSYAADSETVQATLYGGMVLPIAFLGGLTWLARRNVKNDEHADEGEHDGE